MATAKKKPAAQKKRLTLQEQADEILSIAEQHGVEQNFFFLRLPLFMRLWLAFGVFPMLSR